MNLCLCLKYMTDCHYPYTKALVFLEMLVNLGKICLNDSQISDISLQACPTSPDTKQQQHKCQLKH